MYHIAEEIKRMKEMFPDIKKENLLETLRACDYSTEDAVSLLLGEDKECRTCEIIFHYLYYMSKQQKSDLMFTEIVFSSYRCIVTRSINNR